MPEVGTSEWFSATDKLTGGDEDEAISPEGGSDEWCFMIQRRLNKPE